MAVELPMKVADILRPLGRDVTHISLDVIGNPLRVGQVTVEEEKKLTIPQSIAILILDAQHLLVHLLLNTSCALQ